MLVVHPGAELGELVEHDVERVADGFGEILTQQAEHPRTRRRGREQRRLGQAALGGGDEKQVEVRAAEDAGPLLVLGGVGRGA